MNREEPMGVVNGMHDDAGRDLHTVVAPEPGRPDHGTLADPGEDLKRLRVEARERDRFRDLLRRAQADFENFQKRVRREREEERRHQHGPFALDLLLVLDDLERATTAARAGDAGPLAQGVAMVRATFQRALHRHGITPINALGQQFDPALHHAVATVAVPGKPAHSVAEVLKQGYRIHERLLRPAEVVVVAPPDAPS